MHYRAEGTGPCGSRLRTPLLTVKPLTEWDALVPEKKRAVLRRYQADVKGHPPAGWVQPDNKEKK